jgi:anti-anti-sigma factor
MDSPRPREDILPLDVVVTWTPTLLSVVVEGEVDLSNAPVLRAKLAAIELNGQGTMLLDMHRLAFCDSNGGRLLLAFLNRAHNSGHRTTIRGATPIVQRLLTLLANGRQPTFE